jgi:hypothetical protein
MNTDRVASPAPAPAPQRKTDAELKTLCEKIRREVSLTPPAVIDALCEGVPTRLICTKAVYVEEVLTIARMLGRSHLLVFREDC